MAVLWLMQVKTTGGLDDCLRGGCIFFFLKQRKKSQRSDYRRVQAAHNS